MVHEHEVPAEEQIRNRSPEERGEFRGRLSRPPGQEEHRVRLTALLGGWNHEDVQRDLPSLGVRPVLRNLERSAEPIFHPFAGRTGGDDALRLRSFLVRLFRGVGPNPVEGQDTRNSQSGQETPTAWEFRQLDQS